MVLAILQKIEKHLSINLEVLLFASITFKKVSSGSEKSSKTVILGLKSPTSAHFMSFSIKFTTDILSVSADQIILEKTFINVQV
jgi:hypothetical protein